MSSTTPYLLAVAATGAAAVLSTYFLFLSPRHGSLPPTEHAYVLTLFCLGSALVVLLVRRLKTNETMLRESEELFRAAFHSSPVGMTISRVSDGRYVETNDTFGTLIGRSRQQIIGSSPIELGLVSAEEREYYIGEVGHGPVRDRAFAIPQPSGEARQVLVSSERIAFRGEPHFIAIFHDITERQRTEETLREQAELLDTSQHIGRMGSWKRDLRTGQLAWPAATCRLFGIEPAEFAGTFDQFLSFIVPEDVADYEAASARVSPSNPVFEAEYRIRRADGAVRWMHSRGRLDRDATGAPIRRIGIVMDMTDQHVASERLQETVALLRDSEAEFRALAESMPQMVWMTRPDGWNTYFNQRWVDYTGLSREESYGHGWNTPLHPDDRQRAWDAWQLAIAGGDYNVECRFRAANGNYRWMLVRGLPLRDDAGRIVKWIGTSTDIDDLKQAQEAALRSEGVQRALAAELETERSRLIAAQAVASVGSWDTDLATLTTIWSAETYRIFEATPEGFPPTHAGFLQLVHPDDRVAVEEGFAESVEHCSPGVMEHRLVTPGGRIKFVEERWQVLRDSQGVPGRAIGTCQDITERRSAQEAIRMQAHMLDQIGQAVIATDTEGRVTYANRFAGELYGWATGDMLGRAITEVTIPQATQKHGHEIMALLQRGETWSGEFLVQNRQGRVFPVHVTDSPVLDGRGRLIGIVGISNDITARKQAEAEVRLKDTLIRMAGRITHTGGWAVELPEERIFWSDEILDILEFPRGSLPTLADALALYPDPWRDKVVAALQACRQDGAAFDLEVEILTAKGTRKWARVIAEAERDAEGAVTRVQGALQDTTEHKHLQQQYLRAQRMESIGTLAGGIAHDLNNVLAPILLSIGLLNEDEHDVQRLETLATIEASAKRGAAMVGRVLSFARGAEGRREQVQVPSLIRDLATIVRDTFPKSIVFDAPVSPDLWTLQADATQLHQVLLNLCVNARDAMPTGGQLTLMANNVVIDKAYADLNIDAQPGPYVILAVEDTGTGIAKEIIDKIFDPFFTTKNIGQGTGLGLATSLAIVTGHKGFMRVYSEPGTGTRFDVYLPAQTTSAKQAPPLPAAAHPRGSGETVLIVDDEPGIRQVARRTLEAFGYRVLLASDGEEAIAMYAQQQADIAVVLTDMMMPLMDGTATIQALVRLNPEVRIIGASGLAADVRAAGAAAARVLYFLPKPFTVGTLLTAVRAVLPRAPGKPSEG